jgi:hypothetical protein
MTARGYRLNIYANSRDEILLAHKPYTVVLVQYGVRKAVGVAKCNPKDQWNPRIGVALAKSRAVAELAEYLIAQESPCFGEAKNA